MKGQREQTTLRLPRTLMDQLREQAQERGDSVNETIIRYLRLGLEEELRRFGPRSEKRPPS